MAELTEAEIEALKAEAAAQGADEPEVSKLAKSTGCAPPLCRRRCRHCRPLCPADRSAAPLLQEGSGTSDEGDSDMDADEDDEELDEAVAVARAKAVAASLRSGRGEGSGGGGGGGDTLADAMAELDMDHYDDSDAEGGTGPRILGRGNPGEGMRVLFCLEPERVVGTPCLLTAGMVSRSVSPLSSPAHLPPPRDTPC